MCDMGQRSSLYARRLVETDIHEAIDTLLSGPAEPFTVLAIHAPPQCGGIRLVRDGLVNRLRTQTGIELVEAKEKWPEGGNVAFNFEVAQLPDWPPSKDSTLRLLITPCTDLAELPGWVTSDEISLRVFTAGQLSLLEAQNLLESHLEGSVDPAAVRTLTRLAGSLPDVLEWLITECRVRGGIERIDGRWRLLDDPVRTVITPIMRTRIAALPANDFAALCELALTEPLSLSAVSAKAGELAEKLLMDGVLNSRMGDELAFAAPGVAEAIRSLSPESEKARVFRAAIAEGRLSEQAVRWAVQHDEAVPLDTLIRFTKKHLDLHDWMTVTAIADLVEEHPDCFVPREADENQHALLAELHLHAAQAARFLPDAERAHAHLDSAEAQALASSAPNARAIFGRLHIIRAELLHYHQGELDAALRYLNRMSGETAHAESVAHTVVHLVWGGRSREARETVRTESRTLRACSPRLRSRVAIADTLALVALGRPQQALRKITHIALQRKLSIRREAWLNEEQQAAYVIAALNSDGPAAFPVLRKHLASTGDDAYRPDLVTFYLARASWEYADGNIDEADRLGSIALEATDLLDPSGVEAALIGLTAETAALRGEYGRARTLRAQFRGVPLRSSAAIHGGAESHIAAAGFIIGEAGESAAVLQEADRFIANEQFGFAAEILYAGVRFQDRNAAKALCDIASHLDGNLHALRIKHAQALRADDPILLLKLADQFSKVGLSLYAAEASATALALVGIPDAISRRAKSHINAIAGKQILAGHELLLTYGGTAPDVIPLTPREQEIYFLISEGLTNQEIAHRLQLSERTIEGHISRLYRKTGDTRRSQGRRIG